MDFMWRLFAGFGVIGCFGVTLCVILMVGTGVSAAIKDISDNRNRILRAENRKLKAALEVMEARLKQPPG